MQKEVKIMKLSTCTKDYWDMNIIIMIPAYNEEKILPRTIETAHKQTLAAKGVFVIANNCTDNTIKVCQELQKKYGEDWLHIIEMPDNPNKKAGAMNKGFWLIMDLYPDTDLMLAVDGDSVLDENLIEVTAELFCINPQLGAVCTACRVLPLKDILEGEKPTWSQKLLHEIQVIEYTLAHANQLEDYEKARVLPGVATTFRVETLHDVRQWNIENGFGDCIWRLKCLVEDYFLTIGTHETTWQAKPSYEIISYADVPLSLAELWDQRLRWFRGTIDVLLERLLGEDLLKYVRSAIKLHLKKRSKLYSDVVEMFRIQLFRVKDRRLEWYEDRDILDTPKMPFNERWFQRYKNTINILRRFVTDKITRREILSIILLPYNLINILLIIGIFTYYPISNTPMPITPFLFLPLFMTIAPSMFTLLWKRKRLTLLQRIIILTMVIPIIYGIWKTFIYFRAIKLSLTEEDKEWKNPTATPSSKKHTNKIQKIKNKQKEAV